MIFEKWQRIFRYHINSKTIWPGPEAIIAFQLTKTIIEAFYSLSNLQLTEERQVTARVFAELVCHIENCVANGTYIF